MNYSALLSLLIILFSVSLISGKNSKRSRKARFISFDSEDGKIDIDLDLSVPFLSIPLDNKLGSDGNSASLLNVNTKAITVVGLMAAVLAFVVPLFFKSSPDQHYRLEDDINFWDISNSMNNLLLRNEKFTPCVQSAVCNIVSRVARANHPTSNDKIIDGVTSHSWFENLTNGTAIQEAVTIGREGNRDCSAIYKDCLMPARLLDNLLDRYGDI